MREKGKGKGAQNGKGDTGKGGKGGIVNPDTYRDFARGACTRGEYSRLSHEL